MPSDPVKAFLFLFYLQITSEIHRRAKRERTHRCNGMVEREREREKEERVGRVSSGPTPDAAARLSPKPRRSSEIESQPQTQRLDHAVEFVVPSSQFALFSFSFSTQSSSTSLLLISFSFSTQSSLAPLISSSQSHRTNDLIVSVSSSSLFPWSFRSLFLPPSLSLTKFVWSSMNCFEQISVSLKCIYWHFCNKICLNAKKMIEKMWKICRKITFSKCYQTLKMVF